MDRKSKMLLQRLGIECCASTLHYAATTVATGSRRSNQSSDATCENGAVTSVYSNAPTSERTERSTVI